ncbi:MAG TPA: hypothetical protein VN326_21900 [Casimicrobiaceae bacterium]|nr:hypothetical protein [Casimicrobiaceae bacterium]
MLLVVVYIGVAWWAASRRAPGPRIAPAREWLSTRGDDPRKIAKSAAKNLQDAGSTSRYARVERSTSSRTRSVLSAGQHKAARRFF